MQLIETCPHDLRVIHRFPDGRIYREEIMRDVKAVEAEPGPAGTTFWFWQSREAPVLIAGHSYAFGEITLEIESV